MTRPLRVAPPRRAARLLTLALLVEPKTALSRAGISIQSNLC